MEDTLPQKLPVHLGIIMDGNGRWAKKRGLPRKAGHAVGAETFRRIATYCKNLGMEHLTVYAFSTENWKRSDEEVGAIMGLLENYLHESIEKMEKDQIRLKILGDTTALSPAIQGLIDKTDAIAARLPGCFQANVCLNYGGRDEIVRAAIRRFAGEFITRKLKLCYEPLNAACVTDEKWLLFVVEQVLSNALKYTREGSITITMEHPKTLVIRDTGIGIAPEDLPRIFEKGYTGYNGRGDQKASGLGLYLCRTICRKLGHSITAESAPDEGTAIRIGLSQRQVRE